MAWKDPKRRLEYNRAYYARPEAKAKLRACQKVYKARPEIREKENAQRRLNYQKPEVKEKRKAYDKEYKSRPEVQERRRAYQRARQFKKNYNITVEDYDRMLLEQNGRCKICGKMPKKKRLAVDHDHLTGQVRSLLCAACNRMIGFAKENVTVLRLAALYLEEHTVE